MILKNDVDVLDKIQELFSDCLRTREFGEFTVSLTMYGGRPVKIQKSDNLCDFIPIAAQGDILVNSNTTQIRIKSTDIPTLSRGALGVKLMKLTDNYVIGVASI